MWVSMDVPDFVKILLEQREVWLREGNAQLDRIVGTGTTLSGPTARCNDGLLELWYKVLVRGGVYEDGQSHRDTSNGEPHDRFESWSFAGALRIGCSSQMAYMFP